MPEREPRGWAGCAIAQQHLHLVTPQNVEKTVHKLEPKEPVLGLDPVPTVHQLDRADDGQSMLVHEAHVAVPIGFIVEKRIVAGARDDSVRAHVVPWHL